MRSISEALARHKQLSLALRRLQEAVRARPSDQAFIDVGLVEDAAKVSEARQKAGIKFDEIQSRIDHLAILDMCAAFENEFAKRIGTALGNLRGVVNNMDKTGPFSEMRERLIREKPSFSGLASMFALLEGKVSRSTYNSMEILRVQRNRLAHGTDLDAPLTITPEETHNLLIEVARELW